MSKGANQDQLPPGWRWIVLKGAIREAQAGFACGERDPQGIVQLRMNNLDTRGNFIWDAVLRVPHIVNNIERYHLLPGDVLFNNTNSTELVGKSALFEEYPEPIVYSNHFTRLRTDEQALLPDFLTSWLNYQWQQGVFAAICNRWIGQSAVKAEKLLNLEFPLPPLPEQQRIAALLKEQLAAVEKARLAAQARLAAIKALPAAYLRQVFPQPGQPISTGWRWVKLGEVCELNPRRPYIERKDNTPTSFIPMDAVDARSGTVINKIVLPYHEIKKGYTYFAERDVLFAKITPCMQNGKHVIAKDLVDGIGYGTTEFHVLRPGVDILPEWVWFFVRQPDLLFKATQYFTGAVGQQRLPLDYLAGLEIPLAPLPDQHRITTHLKEQLTTVDQSRLAAEAELAAINALPAALLRRAFNGEL